jgi:hypothetical protein
VRVLRGAFYHLVRHGRSFSHPPPLPPRLFCMDYHYEIYRGA